MDPITQALKDLTKDLLSEEALNELQKVITAVIEEKAEEKANIKLQAQIHQIDEDVTDRIKELLEAVDNSHCDKLESVVNAINENHYNKLKAVVSHYEGVIKEDANEYKQNLVTHISSYLDKYLAKAYPQDLLAEAVKNKRATKLVNEMRNLLGVDLAFAQNSIKDGILDGKIRLDEATDKAADLEKKHAELLVENQKLQTKVLLQEKTASLPDEKRKYILKTLGGKSVEFINENFEYTLNMFNEAHENLTREAKSEALKTSKTANIKIEPVKTEVINENAAPNFRADPVMNSYMSELTKF